LSRCRCASRSAKSAATESVESGAFGMKPSFLNPIRVADLEFWLGFLNDEDCLFAYVKADLWSETVRLPDWRSTQPHVLV
jgi:hypothetical protein